ncbi:hypothetical protein R50073_19460 [Maricurvus nonylphenolicus]|uniref:substrate-binding periplasmic protein n=1 Tax=Maricurvus nonylphenolicus TaxID=1008307 RepID=UPI0036F30AF6
MEVWPTYIARILCVCFLWTAYICSHAAAESKLPSRVNIGVYQTEKPLIYQAENGQWHGIFAERYKDIFSPLNIEIDFTGFDNYPRVISALSQGHIDSAVNIREENGRLRTNEFMVCTDEPFTQTRWGAYIQATEYHAPVSTTELSQYTVGAIRVLDLEHLSLFNEGNVVLVRHIKQLPKLLKSGRVDAIVTSPLAIEYWRQTEGMDLKEIHSFGFYYSHLCFSSVALGKENAEQLKTRIDTQLKQNNPLLQ